MTTVGADLTVRPAMPADAAALCELSTAAIRQAAAAHYSEPQLAAWAATRSVAGHRDLIERTDVFVAVDAAGDVAGFGSVALTPSGALQRGEVDQLFVGPRHGGRGVARLLLRTIEAAALAAGVRTLVTHASWRAVPVFERCGFSEVEVETVHLADQVLTRALMRKPLDDRPGRPQDVGRP
ncbi:GNAT family N-acetyltransferase [Modestobacter versicolor]|uniref:GNAT family N-acetyltransferase n=1 Tax=Modestobacter versicolor TaxID=429133 RepID=UPI0034DDEFD8